LPAHPRPEHPRRKPTRQHSEEIKGEIDAIERVIVFAAVMKVVVDFADGE